MKKGFTLIELIITIGLLAIIGLVIVTNMSGTLDNQQQQQYEEFKATLQNATCTYIDSNKAQEDGVSKTTCRTNGSCTISLSNVLKAGLITEDDLYNPRTQVKIPTTNTVTVTYTNGLKTCSYNE